MTDQENTKANANAENSRKAKSSSTKMWISIMLLLGINLITIYNLNSAKSELSDMCRNIQSSVEDTVSGLNLNNAETKDLIDKLMEQINASDANASLTEKAAKAQIQHEKFLAISKISEARTELEKLIAELDSKSAKTSSVQDRKIVEFAANFKKLEGIVKNLEKAVEELDNTKDNALKGFKKEVEKETSELLKRVDKLYELYENVALRIVQQFNKADRTARDIPNILAKINKLETRLELELDREVNNLKRSIQNLDTKISTKIMSLENKIRALERK